MALTMLLSILSISASGNDVSLKVYYMPFSVETLTAVSAENIQSRTKACVISSAEDVKRLVELIGAARPTGEKFGEDFVRVRVDRQESGKERLFALIDKTGTVLRGGDPAALQLPEEQLMALKGFLAKRCKW